MHMGCCAGRPEVQKEVVVAAEEQIKELAYSLWKQEGCPCGRDREHYFMAKKQLEEKEAAMAVYLDPPPVQVHISPASLVWTSPARSKVSSRR